MALPNDEMWPWQRDTVREQLLKTLSATIPERTIWTASTPIGDSRSWFEKEYTLNPDAEGDVDLSDAVRVSMTDMCAWDFKATETARAEEEQRRAREKQASREGMGWGSW
ncbi:hypothetical protein ACODYM_28805 [Burkholderia gladioli]|uniref:hypothetical protein n=1 Tax=Burkholderia gladioli TaxID=28095 RepID=UPI003B511992